MYSNVRHYVNCIKNKDTLAALIAVRDIQNLGCNQLIHENNSVYTLLSLAIAYGEYEVAEVLVLEHRVDIEIDDETVPSALSRACSADNLDTGVLLLESGANPFRSAGAGFRTERIPFLNAIVSRKISWIDLFLKYMDFKQLDADMKNATLEISATSNNMDALSMLLDKDVNITELNNEAPLKKHVLHYLKYRSDNLEILSKILRSNPNSVHAKDVHGNTPLHCCVLFGGSECAELLMKYGADANAVNNSGYTPVQIARDNKLSYLLPILTTHT